jgi:hypothetical protein
LTTDFFGLLQHERVKTEFIAPESSGQTCGPGADDDHVMHV